MRTAEGTPGARLFAALPPQRREVAIELAHWSYGAGMGVAYGVLPERLRRSPITGPAFGVAIWAFFEAGVAPVLGLRSNRERPVTERASTAPSSAAARRDAEA